MTLFSGSVAFPTQKPRHVTSSQVTSRHVTYTILLFLEREKSHEITPKMTKNLEKYSVHPNIENTLAQELGVDFDLDPLKAIKLYLH